MGTVAANDKYSGALSTNLQRSRLLPLWVALAAAATLALVAASPLPLAGTLLLATWTACVAIDAVRRSRQSRELALAGDGSLTVDARPGVVREGCFVAPWLTVIRWRPAGARFDHTLLVLPDMLPADDFRRLRVLLRWE